MSKYAIQILTISSFLLIQSAIATSEKRTTAMGFRVQVHVVDKLPKGSPPLYLHCASGDNDLGYHHLARNQDFNFHFVNNDRTLFFCHLWWSGKDRAFEVYADRWRKERCIDSDTKFPARMCYWVAQSDGIYRATKNFTHPTKLVKDYDW